MIINFVPSDFDGSFAPQDCALTHSLKRNFIDADIRVGVYYVVIGNRDYEVFNTKFNGNLIGETGFTESYYDLIKENIRFDNFESASVEIQPLY